MKIFSYLIIIFLTPVLILLNFRLLVFNRSFYQNEFAKLAVYENFRSTAVVDNQSSRLIEFLCCQGTLDENFYSARERLHLIDVKNLINLVNIQFYIFLTVVIAISFILYSKKHRQFILQSFKIGSIFTILSIILLWLSSKINFDLIFLKFHYLSFNNDYWLLPEDSNLTKLFPQQFFADFANRVALQTIIMSIAMLTASYLAKKKYNK